MTQKTLITKQEKELSFLIKQGHLEIIPAKPLMGKPMFQVVQTGEQSPNGQTINMAALPNLLDGETAERILNINPKSDKSLADALWPEEKEEETWLQEYYRLNRVNKNLSNEELAASEQNIRGQRPSLRTIPTLLGQDSPSRDKLISDKSLADALWPEEKEEETWLEEYDRLSRVNKNLRAEYKNNNSEELSQYKTLQVRGFMPRQVSPNQVSPTASPSASSEQENSQNLQNPNQPLGNKPLHTPRAANARNILPLGPIRGCYDVGELNSMQAGLGKDFLNGNTNVRGQLLELEEQKRVLNQNIAAQKPSLLSQTGLCEDVGDLHRAVNSTVWPSLKDWGATMAYFEGLAAVGGAVGGAFAGAATGGPGIIPGAAAGAVNNAIAAAPLSLSLSALHYNTQMVFRTYEEETGSFAAELCLMTDENGNYLDPEDIKITARAYGVIAGGLEGFGGAGIKFVGGKIFKKLGIRGPGQLFRSIFKAALRNTEGRKRLVDVFADIAETRLEDLTVEKMQRGAKEAIKFIVDIDDDNTTP